MMQDLVNTPKRPRSAATKELLTFENVPDYLKDNPFIRTGYRPQLSLSAAAASIFQWHNETLNIWSHLSGLALFVYYTIDTALDKQRDSNAKWPLLVFLAGAMACFVASAIFHTLLCVSPWHAKTFIRLDFAAIILVMWSMYWPWIVYTFGTRSLVTSITYLSIATLISTGTACTALTDAMAATAALKFLRPVLFGIQAIFGIVPLVHASSMYWPRVQFGTYMVLTQLALHLLGATIYSTKVPERFFPGTFDLCLGSHTIFHILIAAGFVAYYYGMQHLSFRIA